MRTMPETSHGLRSRVWIGVLLLSFCWLGACDPS